MSMFFHFKPSAAGGAPPSYTYATWNSADKSANILLSGGDLIATANTTAWKSVRGTIGHSTGKHYFEITGLTDIYTIIGIATASADINSYFTDNLYGAGYYRAVNEYMLNGAQTATGRGDFATPVGVIIDLTGKTLKLQYDPGGGSVMTNAFDITPMLGGSPTVYPAASVFTGGNSVTANFGATPFAMTVPSGYREGWYTT